MAAINIGMPRVMDSGERVWEGEPLRISNSELQTWKDCHRKWWLGYYRRLGLNDEKQEVTGPRSLGTRIHATLEFYYTHDTSAITFMKDMYADTAEELTKIGRHPDEIEGLWKEFDLAEAMMSGYIEWVEEEGIDYGITVVASEEVLEVSTSIQGVNLRGKMDQRVVRDSDGARLFRDFKTVGNLTSPAKQIHMDEQMKTYHLLEYMDSLDKTGGEPQWRTDGALYTMLRKVKRTASAKPPFYGQFEVRHNLQTIRTMWIRVQAEIQEIFDARVKLDAGVDHHHVVYPRPNGECSWKCDYFAICSMFDDGTNVEGMIDAYYKVGDPDERYNRPTDEQKGSE